MNQFRRDVFSGHWSIVIEDEYDMKNLISHSKAQRNASETQQHCKYSGGREMETAPEIFAIRRPGSQKNESGWQVRVLPHNEPILQIQGDLNNRGVGFYDVLDGIGAHELVIETPNCGEHLHAMPREQIHNVLQAYRERIIDLKRDNRFRHILVHKNYGEGTGTLKYHSHSHIIATPITPTRVKFELMHAFEHFQFKERCLFCDVITQELDDEVRLVDENDAFLAYTPFASRGPFEVWILPKKHETFFEWNTEYALLADLLKKILGKIRDVLNDPNLIIELHSGPNVSAGFKRGYWKTLESDFHWHIEITPRFRGYMNFYIGSGFQVNVVSPEKAAQILRDERIS
jgi:UDPglucose--hexose-1-phosphate uridylyltransferase